MGAKRGVRDSLRAAVHRPAVNSVVDTEVVGDVELPRANERSEEQAISPPYALRSITWKEGDTHLILPPVVISVLKVLVE